MLHWLADLKFSDLVFDATSPTKDGQVSVGCIRVLLNNTIYGNVNIYLDIE